jgi:hypothetical protein
MPFPAVDKWYRMVARPFHNAAFALTSTPIPLQQTAFGSPAQVWEASPDWLLFH